MNDEVLAILSKIHGLEHAKGVIDREIAALKGTLAQINAATAKEPLPPTGPQPEKKKRRISPEVRARKIQTLVQARAALAAKREKERQEEEGEKTNHSNQTAVA